mmetsp:Transcript_19565/g.45748  ORF Transcript_19565/g.45748 Transcript_19565/m.45748 type:complete len:88 (-) Transcript_19565:37-300(-)
MAGPTPLVKRNIIKKRTKKFIRHQSDRFDRVSESWRRPKGIDSRVTLWHCSSLFQDGWPYSPRQAQHHQEAHQEVHPSPVGPLRPRF